VPAGNVLIATGSLGNMYRFSINQPALTETRLLVPSSTSIALYISLNGSIPTTTNYDILATGSSISQLLLPSASNRTITVGATGPTYVGVPAQIVNRAITLSSMPNANGNITISPVVNQRDYYSIVVNSASLAVSVILNTTKPDTGDTISLTIDANGTFGANPYFSSSSNPVYYSQAVIPGTYQIIVQVTCLYCRSYTIYAYDTRSSSISSLLIPPGAIAAIAVGSVLVFLFALSFFFVLLCCLGVVAVPTWMKGYWIGKQKGIIMSTDVDTTTDIHTENEVGSRH
jgi:hypothetical protein